MATFELEWPKFERAIKEKLAAGYKEYGDKSFDGPLDWTIKELEAEAIDIVGWGFILWCKIQRYKNRAANLQSALDKIGSA